MFDVVRKFTDSESKEISARSTELLEAWSELKEVYRIPKRVVSAHIYIDYIIDL